LKRLREVSCTYCLVNKSKNSIIKIIDMDYRMVALERPYANLFFHKECYNILGNYDELIKFINENFDCIFNKK